MTLTPQQHAIEVDYFNVRALASVVPSLALLSSPVPASAQQQLCVQDSRWSTCWVTQRAAMWLMVVQSWVAAKCSACSFKLTTPRHEV